MASSSSWKRARENGDGLLKLHPDRKGHVGPSNTCSRRSYRRRGRPTAAVRVAAAALGAAAAVAVLALSVAPAEAASTSTYFTSVASDGAAAIAPPWILRGGAMNGGGRRPGAKGVAETPSYARNPPRDAVLYDELEVHWGATAREIKKAYYRLAVQHHPDKKPGDAHAEERFKRVSEAYQILQDDSVREKYHRRGVSALEEDSWGGSDGGASGGGGGGGRESRGRRSRVDPMEVFRTFLGGGMFEHLIGPLSPRMVPVRDPDYHHQKSKSLAEDLERRLEVGVRGNLFWFDQSAWTEALQLREQPMGRQILRTVGYVYKNYAQRSLGKLSSNVLQPEAIRGRMKFYSDQAHRVNNLLSAVSSTTRLYVHLQTRKPENSHPSPDRHHGTGKRHKPADRYSSNEEETVARVMEALWSVHRVDVEHTVQRACKMVLRDPRMPPSVLKKRAEALMRLGRIFTWAAKGKNPEPGTFNFVESAAASDPFSASGTFASSGAATAASPAPAAAAPADGTDPSSYGGDAGLGRGGDSGHLGPPQPLPPPPVPSFFGVEAGGFGGGFGFDGNEDVGGGSMGEMGLGAGAEGAEGAEGGGMGFGEATQRGGDSGGAGCAGDGFVGGGGVGEGLWGAGGGGAGDGWSPPPSGCSYPDYGVDGRNGDDVVGEISGISGAGSSRHRGSSW